MQIKVVEHSQFQDFDDFLDYIENTPPQGKWANDPSSRTFHTKEWDLGVNFNKALELGRYGWPEGAERLSSQQLNGDILSEEVKAGFIRDIEGQFPIVPLYLAGDPMVMMQYSPQEVLSPILDVVVYIQASAGVKDDNFFTYGAASASLIDSIEDSGVRVNLSLRWQTSKDIQEGFETAWLDVVIKDASQPLDRDRLAFVVSHPAFMRRLVFAWLETKPDLYWLFSWGYGYPSKADKTLHEDAFVVDGVSSDMSPQNFNVVLEGLVKRYNEWAAMKARQ